MKTSDEFVLNGIKMTTVPEEDARIAARERMAVPFIAQIYKGEKDIEYAGLLLPAVRQYAEKYADDLFSDEALRFLDHAVYPLLSAQGYFREEYAARRFYYLFEADDEKFIEYEKISRECVRIDSRNIKRFKNLTTLDLNLMIRCRLPVFGALEGDKIAAAASVNPYSPGQRRLELNCECARGYRRNGYAISALLSLIGHLFSKGKTVAYCTSRFNYASVALAHSAGLLYAGKFFPYTVFSDNQKGINDYVS